MLKLQGEKNCLARLLTRVGRFAPSTPPPMRHTLKCLPISFKIQFKILTLKYKTLSSGKPSYLANFIYLATPGRNLRFNKGSLCSAPKCILSKVFSVCASSLSRKLPLCIHSSESLTSFRQSPKTHLLACRILLSDLTSGSLDDEHGFSLNICFLSYAIWLEAPFELGHADDTDTIEVLSIVLYCTAL